MHLMKYIFIFLTAFVYFQYLTDTNMKKYEFILKIIVLSLLSSYVRIKHISIAILFSYGIFFLTQLISLRLKWKPVFIVSLISFCLSQVTYMLANFVCFMLLSPFPALYPSTPGIPSVLLSGMIAIMFSRFLCRWPRFKKGIKYLYKEPAVTFVTLIGLVIIICLTIPQTAVFSDYRIKLISLFILAFAFLFFFFWHQQIRRYYLTKLRRLELESLRQEIEEKDEKIKSLTESNDHLARMIHKDNKLIPAMLSAVTDYLEQTGADVKGQASQGKALAKQLRELGCDRANLLAKSSQTHSSLPSTGHAGVDAMLSYMGKRAESEQITYQVRLHPDFPSRIEAEISEADLTHLLSDLIENAMIATKTVDSKSVLVHLDILCSAPTLEISDTGIPFAPEVYQDLGLSRHSTHLENGGSGIGLMDIWSLKKKYAASLHIYEYQPGSGKFTKKISLVFDHKKHYLIRSYRSEELVRLQTRSDLYILPLEEASH